jgi:UTP--glucose-1-phosphate uridylyltransferase
MHCFIFMTGVIVPRKRFLPVKKTSDLLIVMSNLYNIKSGSLEMNQLRSIDLVPLVKLGAQFNKVSTW